MTDANICHFCLEKPSRTTGVTKFWATHPDACPQWPQALVRSRDGMERWINRATVLTCSDCGLMLKGGHHCYPNDKAADARDLFMAEAMANWFTVPEVRRPPIERALELCAIYVDKMMAERFEYRKRKCGK